MMALAGWAQWFTDVGILLVFTLAAWLMLREW